MVLRSTRSAHHSGKQTSFGHRGGVRSCLLPAVLGRLKHAAKPYDFVLPPIVSDSRLDYSSSIINDGLQLKQHAKIP